MTELELLRAFFHRWEELHLLPKAPGRKSKQHEEAATRLVEAARQIKDYVPPATVAAMSDPGVNDLRALQNQVAAMPPRDGFKGGLKWPT